MTVHHVFPLDVVKNTREQEHLRPFLRLALDWIIIG